MEFYLRADPPISTEALHLSPPSIHPPPWLGPWDPGAGRSLELRYQGMGQAGGAQAAKDSGEGFHQAPRALQKEEEL